ncbi:MAG: hypothetical protein ACTSRP_14315 [Candidatus Helarchaeota archaeon]
MNKCNMDEHNSNKYNMNANTMDKYNIEEYNFLKQKLFKSYSRRRTTMFTVAQHISRNEAKKLLNKLEKNNHLNPKELKELKARILTLNSKRILTISPFNPPNSFYLWKVSDYGYIELECMGRNIKEVVINVMKYIIKNCYNVNLIKCQYFYSIKDNKGIIGKLAFMKRDNKRNECLIAKIYKDKILMLFDNEGLLIHIKIYCPKNIKEVIYKKFVKLEEEFSNLYI